MVISVIRLPINPVSPEAEAIAMASDAVRAGRIVAIPTDTLYGLAADPFNVEAVARIYQLKGRGSDRALPLVAADVDQIAATLGVLPRLAHLLAVRFWPGPLTMLMPAPERLPADVTGGVRPDGVVVPGHAGGARLW